MVVLLRIVSIENKHVLRNLLELYLYDFTQFDKCDVNSHGLCGYKYLDHCWTEPGMRSYSAAIKFDEPL